MSRIITGTEAQLVDWLNLREAYRPRHEHEVMKWSNERQRYLERLPRALLDQIKKLVVSAPHGSGLWCYACADRITGEPFRSNVNCTGAAMRGKSVAAKASIHAKEHVFSTWTLAELLVWRDAWIEGQSDPRVLSRFLRAEGLTVTVAPIPDTWVPGYAAPPLTLEASR